MDAIFVLASGERDRTGKKKSFLSLQGPGATLASSRWTAHSRSLFLLHGLASFAAPCLGNRFMVWFETPPPLRRSFFLFFFFQAQH